MTEKQARALIDQLTKEEKILLYSQLKIREQMREVNQTQGKE